MKAHITGTICRASVKWTVCRAQIMLQDNTQPVCSRCCCRRHLTKFPLLYHQSTEQLQSSDCATQHEHISFVTFCIVFLCILRNQTVLDIFLFKMYPSAPSNCQRTSLHPYASYIILWRVEHILYHKTFIKVGSMNLIWWHFSASCFFFWGGGGLGFWADPLVAKPKQPHSKILPAFS